MADENRIARVNPALGFKEFKTFLQDGLSDLDESTYGPCLDRIFPVDFSNPDSFDVAKFDGIDPVRIQTQDGNPFIWTSLSEEGQVIVTGSTNYQKPSSYGDLFTSYKVLPEQTARSIYDFLLRQEKIPALPIQQLEQSLNNFPKTAFVIPLKVRSIEEVSPLEIKIGDRIASVYDVLNPYSQHNGKEPEGNWQHEAWKGNPDFAKQYGIY